jgi:SAM-dependent methyltransferase
MNSRPSWLVRLYYAATRPPRVGLSVGRILSGFGYWRSARSHEPVDAAGREIPWFTYPAIEYLNQFDFGTKTVFEFGAGNSTVYWCRRARQVVSVESNRSWYEHVRPRLAANGELHLVEAAARYPRILAARPESFDVIVIDGIERRACCAEAVKKLRPGGLIILDNSDWHHRCAALLRAAGLLEVDLAGFGPINGYTWTTSFFFDRAFAFPLRQDRQPVHGIGSLPERESEA